MQNEELPSEVKLYNPLLTDFECEWLNDENLPQKIVLPSLTITTLPYGQGRFAAKHLTDTVCLERGIKNNSDLWREVYEEVTINDFI